VVWKLYRLGRSLREVLNTAHDLQQQGIQVRSLTEKLDTVSANGRLMFNILGTLAEYFLDLNRE
jgi:DNA invertase Pin-like site-specific DNA recombinase